jgi:hypothetical protein
MRIACSVSDDEQAKVSWLTARMLKQTTIPPAVSLLNEGNDVLLS